jgi:hypothetical protein
MFIPIPIPMFNPDGVLVIAPGVPSKSTPSPASPEGVPLIPIMPLGLTVPKPCWLSDCTMGVPPKVLVLLAVLVMGVR